MNPAIIETIKMLAGIANAERISPDARDVASKQLAQLLRLIQKDIDAALAASLGIQFAQA